jgi:CRISPR-associated protein Cas5t
MWEGIRVVLIAYTASFRVPSFIGHQLTLPVPPLSTIYGLLSSAAGRWILPNEVDWLAFRCEHGGMAMDLEAIVTFERGKMHQVPNPGTRNVIRREFLVLPRLILYLPPEWESAFQRPRYNLLLGRTQDVASVESLAPATLESVDEGELSGVLLPFEVVMRTSAPSWLHNLPIAFTAEPQRRLLGMKIFGVLDSNRRPTHLKLPNWLARDVSDSVIVPVYQREWILNVTR